MRIISYQTLFIRLETWTFYKDKNVSGKVSSPCFYKSWIVIHIILINYLNWWLNRPYNILKYNNTGHVQCVGKITLAFKVLIGNPPMHFGHRSKMVNSGFMSLFYDSVMN